MHSRRSFLKSASVSGIALASPAFSFNILSRREPDALILGHGHYRYQLDSKWARINASETPLLNCHEMVMDSKGRLIMVGDHPRNNVLIFDKSGKLLDSWGTAYPGGHGLSILKDGGEDFLFITDSGWYLGKNGDWISHNGRVSKTTIDGRVVFDIGHPQTIGIYQPGDPFRPTETAVAPNGDIYVADGYGMDYIIQYNHQGEYIRHWGGHHNEDKNYNLSSAHGISIDYRDKSCTFLICTSRNENMFKFFTLDGRYVRSVHLPNMYVCRAVIDENNLYAGVCWSAPEGGVFNWKEHTGFVTILEGDKVVSNPGGTSPKYQEDKLQPAYQLPNAPIRHGHDVCIDEDKNLYICQWNANGSAPLKLKRI